MQTQHIIPAIIPDSLDHLQTQLREVRGVANRVQIDVMNGSYAETSSWPYEGAGREMFESIRREDDGLPYWQDFDFEIDLMVAQPELRLEEWTLAGAKCLIVHVESTEKLDEICTACRTRRVEFALALKPSTDVEKIAPYADRALFVQCMGNDRIGEHGVPLDTRVHETIRAIKKRWPAMTVGVDIGVNANTLPGLIHAGATRFATGSAVFATGDAAREYQQLERIAADELKKK